MVGIQIDSSTGPANCGTPLSLQRVGSHEVKRLKQKIELDDEEPEVLDDDQSCPKKFSDDASLRCPGGRIFPAEDPIHDHPGWGHEIREVVGQFNIV